MKRPAHPDHLSTPPARATFSSAVRRLAGALALGMLCVIALPAAAQWVWKDENGRVTASDRPPPKNVPDKDIMSRPKPLVALPAPAASASAPATPSGALPSAADRELEARKRAADQAQEAAARAAEQKLAEQRAENCRRARSHQATLDSGQRISRTNDKGEREILDDQARAEEMRRTRELISTDCSR